jgi:hypothetical protein
LGVLGIIYVVGGSPDDSLIRFLSFAIRIALKSLQRIFRSPVYALLGRGEKISNSLFAAHGIRRRAPTLKETRNDPFRPIIVRSLPGQLDRKD